MKKLNASISAMSTVSIAILLLLSNLGSILSNSLNTENRISTESNTTEVPSATSESKISKSPDIFTEDFTTTTYRNATATTVQGWGTGSIRLPNKTLVEVGNCDTPGYPLGIYVSGCYAYVSDYYTMRIINITNPASPIEVGNYNTPDGTLGIYVSGQYAYVAAGANGLRIINVTNPGSPTGAGYYTTLEAHDVYVSGQYAYVADYNGGLCIINITNPGSPTQVGSCTTPTLAYGVYVSGQYAYVADGGNGFRIINVTNPASPTQVGYYNTPGDAYDVYVSGQYAYVADYGSGLRIINVSNPASPTEVGYCDTPDSADDVYVSGQYAYVSDHYGGLRIINVTNPASPTEVGYYAPIDNNYYGVYVSGQYAYVADYNYGLRVIEIADLYLPPQEVGYNDTPGIAYGVYVSGQYAYVADAGSGLRIINVTNPNSPTEVGYYDTPGAALGVYVSGQYAYVADYGSGLRIINVTIPSSPAEFGYYDTPGNATAVYVSGQYAYVADYDYGLRIINVTNPASPTEVGFYDTPGYAFGVYVSGQYAYVADYGSGLRIINVTNPASPTEVGYYDTPGTARGVYVSGQYAYVADTGSGLRIINVTNPASPTEIGYKDTSGNAFGVYVSGRYAYVTDGTYGLRIINVSNPASPTEVGYYDTPGTAFCVYVSGQYAYVADYDVGGLRVIEVMRGKWRQYQSSGKAVSREVDTMTSDITKATLTSTNSTPANTAITYYLSANNGTNWEVVSAGLEYTFANTGNQLLFNATLSTTDGMNVTPSISQIVIDYYAGLPPITKPTSLGVQGFISGASLQHITNHTPALNWSVSGQSGYNVSVWNGTVGSGTVMWYKNTTGTNKTATYDEVGGNMTALSLADGLCYNLSVSATNGTDWNTSDPLMFRMNSIPAANAGADKNVSDGDTVSFSGTVTPSTDPEGDTLSISWDFWNENGTQTDATGLSASTVYNLSGKYNVTFTVSDGYENSTDVLVVKVNRTLNLSIAGWNTAGWTSDDMNASELYDKLIAAGAGSVTISKWNNTERNWDGYLGPSSTNFTLTYGVGYFIFVNTAASIELENNSRFVKPTQQFSLAKNWTCVGRAGGNATDAKTLGEKIRDQLGASVTISKWNATAGNWDGYIVGISPIRYNFSLLPGGGYLIFTNVAGTVEE